MGMRIKMVKNRWMRGLNHIEVVNWIKTMLEIGRYEVGGYWEPQKMVRDPFGKPLAWVRG